jgi:Flp pilus assembly protein TadD
LEHLGIVLGDLGRYEQAIASFDKAVKIKPDDHSAWYNKGIALEKLGRYEQAIASFDKAVKLNQTTTQLGTTRYCTREIRTL